MAIGTEPELRQAYRTRPTARDLPHCDELNGEDKFEQEVRSARSAIVEQLVGDKRRRQGVECGNGVREEQVADDLPSLRRGLRTQDGNATAPARLSNAPSAGHSCAWRAELPVFDSELRSATRHSLPRVGNSAGGRRSTPGGDPGAGSAGRRRASHRVPAVRAGRLPRAGRGPARPAPAARFRRRGHLVSHRVLP